MTYQPLATKYRPSRFSELVGQEVAAQALANAIEMGRAPRQLVFTGVRGVGKTTVSRLYAKALNCEQRLPGAEPCNTCASCVAIARGHHEDVLEIDGASNTGVNDVRALQETIDYRPQRSSFKVYVVDEVHMLSQAAFNALLKTLEELPSHAVFVFATTEINKVPATILSRCQTFYLKKLPTPLIHARLKEILAREGIEAEDKALAAVAREGHGSMRDALTLLDQAISLGHGKVTSESLGRVTASLSSTASLELLAALVARDAARALAVVAALDEAGVEFERAAETAAELARHAFVAQGLGVKALDVALLGLDDAELATLARIAEAAQPLDLNRIFRTLVKCRSELDGSALDRYVFENYLFEWCFDPGFPDVEALLGGGGLPAAEPAARPSAAPSGGGGAPAPGGQPPRKLAGLRAAMDEIKAGNKGAGGGGAFAPKPDAAPPAAGAAQRGTGAGASAAERAAATPPPARAPAGGAGGGLAAASAGAPHAAATPAPAGGAPHVHSSVSASAGAPHAARPVAGSAGAPHAASPAAASVAESPPASSKAPLPAASSGTAEGAASFAPPTAARPGGDIAAARPATAAPAPSPRPATAAPSPRPGASAAPSRAPTPPPLDDDMPPPPGDFDAPPSEAFAIPVPVAPRVPSRSAAAEAPQRRAPPSPEPPRSGASSESAGRFPASWRALVDGWKQLKPLQARKLEEAHPLEYGPDRIVIAVREDSFASRVLLQSEEQRRIVEAFRDLFDFRGILLVQPRAAGASAAAPGAAAPVEDEALPETILTERNREADERRRKLLADAREAPFTRDLQAALGATLEDVRLPDGGTT